MWELIIASILFIGWFILITFLINIGDKKTNLFKRGF